MCASAFVYASSAVIAAKYGAAGRIDCKRLKRRLQPTKQGGSKHLRQAQLHHCIALAAPGE